MLVDHLVDKARFSRTRHARHAYQLSERYVHIDVPEVVLGSSADAQEETVALAALVRKRYSLPAAEVLSGYGLLTFQELVHSTGKNHLSAVNSCARTYIDDMVGSKHSVVVVLDYYQRISEVTETLQRSYELVVVALVETYARLIENVQDSHERRAYLRSKADTLALTAGESSRGTREREVLKTYADKKAEAFLYLLDYAFADESFVLRELYLLEECKSIADRKVRKIADILLADSNGKVLVTEPFSVADRAVNLAHIALNVIPRPFARGLAVTALEVIRNALERGIIGAAAE